MVAYLKTQSVLELLNDFSNLSTVAYKGVAYKKKIVYQIVLEFALRLFVVRKIGNFRVLYDFDVKFVINS